MISAMAKFDFGVRQRAAHQAESLQREAPMGNEASDVLNRFRHGDIDAFETIFRQHQRAVYNWILRIVRNPATAEDLTVETFWRIHRAHARFDPARGFEGWARHIATHAALDWMRSGRTERELTAELLDDSPRRGFPTSRLRGDSAKDRRSLYTPAAQAAHRGGAGGGGRTTAQGCCRSAGHFGCRRETARVSRASIAEKGPGRAGNQTMNAHDQDESRKWMKKLLQQSLPPVGAEQEPERDFGPPCCAASTENPRPHPGSIGRCSPDWPAL
jgi:RNA polymerase sigma factor (sigma-70 family)